MNRLIKEGLLTSIVGLAILGFAGALIWFKGHTMTEVGGWIGLAVMFLRAKDTLLGLPENKKSEDKF